MTDKNFDKIYTVFFQKRNLAISSGKTDLQLLGFVIEELNILNVSDYNSLLNRVLVKFSKSKMPSKVFSRYNKLSIDNLILNENKIYPNIVEQNIKLLNKNFDEILKSLSKISGKDLYRPTVEGVLLNSSDNEMVATDANILLAIPYKLSGKNTVVQPKTNLKKNDKSVALYKKKYRIISGSYPLYKNVIPKYTNTSKIFEALVFLNHVKAIEKLANFFDDKDKFVIKLVAKEQTLFISPFLLSRLLQAMIEQGVEQFKFQWADEEARGKPIFISSLNNKKIKSLIMPYLIQEKDNDYAFIEFDLYGKSLKKKIVSKTKAKPKPIIENRKGRSKKALSLKAKAIKIKLQLLKL